MAYAEDLRDKINRTGNVGAEMPSNIQRSLQALRRNNANQQATELEGVSVIDPAVDLVWAAGALESEAPNSYFDYYFTGQDVKVWIDGLDSPDAWPYNDMPIQSFAFNIKQEKTPVFGFWSYTYDTVMRGTRIITGAFSIYTRSPGWMTRALSVAAEARSNKRINYPFAPGTIDERNIDQYWGRNTVGNGAKSGRGADRSMFLVHPPFTFVVKYNIQSQSIDGHSAAANRRVKQRLADYGTDNSLFTDTNERLVEGDTSESKLTFAIEAVEITGMQKQYDPSGRPCGEMYTFFAKDMVHN